MSVRTGAAVSAWAKSHTSWSPVGTCLIFAHDAFNVGAKYGTARLGWLNAKKKHRQSHGAGIPANVPIWWVGGSHGYGHVAVSLGNGLCRSTDWPRSYQVSTARIDDISRAWNLTFVGWSEDINDVTVYDGSVPPTGTVLNLNAVRNAVHQGISLKHGVTLKKAVAAEVGAGSMVLTNGILGQGFRDRYELVQEKYLKALGQKVRAQDADGIPGLGSLAWLGSRHGFHVG